MKKKVFDPEIEQNCIEKYLSVPKMASPEARKHFKLKFLWVCSMLARRSPGAAVTLRQGGGEGVPGASNGRYAPSIKKSIS